MKHIAISLPLVALVAKATTQTRAFEHSKKPPIQHDRNLSKTDTRRTSKASPASSSAQRTRVSGARPWPLSGECSKAVMVMVKATYKEQLKPLSNKRIVFIFDECHRSQFGENHKAIKEFFPQAQLFGFTGTPTHADLVRIEGDIQKATRKHNEFLKKLGLPLLPSAESSSSRK